MNQAFIVLLWMAAASVATAQVPSSVTPTTAAGPIDASSKQASNGDPDGHQGARSGKSATSGSNTPGTARSPGSSFVQLDTNKDGFLSTEEMNAVAGNVASVRFQRMDTDHDGKISAAEYSAGQTQAIKQSDKSPAGSTTTDPTGDAHASRPPGSRSPGSSQH